MNWTFFTLFLTVLANTLFAWQLLGLGHMGSSWPSIYHMCGLLSRSQGGFWGWRWLVTFRMFSTSIDNMSLICSATCCDLGDTDWDIWCNRFIYFDREVGSLYFVRNMFADNTKGLHKNYLNIIQANKVKGGISVWSWIGEYILDIFYNPEIGV